MYPHWPSLVTVRETVAMYSKGRYTDPSTQIDGLLLLINLSSARFSVASVNASTLLYLTTHSDFSAFVWCGKLGEEWGRVDGKSWMLGEAGCQAGLTGQGAPKLLVPRPAGLTRIVGWHRPHIEANAEDWGGCRGTWAKGA